MQLRLKSRLDVTWFMISITSVSALGCTILLYVLLSPELSRQVYLPGLMIVVILTMPITYFVGANLLENTRLTEALEQAADHDVLTGAATRSHFFRQISRLPQGPHAVIAVDIDRFKSINDQYGHDVGDEALKHVTSVLRENCRNVDIVARFGGEEFILLINQADKASGLSAAERLCRVLPEHPLEVSGETLRLTASFGVAELSPYAEVQDVLKHADLAAYRAKAEGRNRVCGYDPALDVPKGG